MLAATLARYTYFHTIFSILLGLDKQKQNKIPKGDIVTVVSIGDVAEHDGRLATLKKVGHLQVDENSKGPRI